MQFFKFGPSHPKRVVTPMPRVQVTPFYGTEFYSFLKWNRRPTFLGSALNIENIELSIWHFLRGKVATLLPHT